MGAETGLSLSPTTWPTSTASPAFTVGTQGAPRCWDIAKTMVAGAGIPTVSLSAVCFREGACTPPRVRDRHACRMSPAVFLTVPPKPSIAIVTMPFRRRDPPAGLIVSHRVLLCQSLYM